MARVLEHTYRDRHIKITVNQSGAEYLGIFQIDGVNVPPATARGAESRSEDAAFESAKRRAEEYIDAQGAGPAGSGETPRAPG
jgi:hypothetical protein